MRVEDLNYLVFELKAVVQDIMKTLGEFDEEHLGEMKEVINTLQKKLDHEARK